MKYSEWPCFFLAMLILLFGLSMISSCDSGKKAVDEVTGNRAVKQFQKMEKDIQKIADQQAERYKSIPDDDNEDNEQ